VKKVDNFNRYSQKRKLLKENENDGNKMQATRKRKKHTLK
jgi:hypothetical protein